MTPDQAGVKASEIRNPRWISYQEMLLSIDAGNTTSDAIQDDMVLSEYVVEPMLAVLLEIGAVTRERKGRCYHYINQTSE